MSSRSSSFGNYTRHIDTPADPFNERVAAFKTTSNTDGFDASDNPEDWSAEKVKRVGLMFQREDQAKQNNIQTGLNGNSFVAVHEEYIDSEANGLLMAHEMNVMFGEGLHPIEHFEAAYQSLRATNFLKLKADVVKAQNIEAAKQRAAAEKARNTPKSEQELYAMSMEDLRRLSDTESHERMQREGETGGF